MALGTGAFMAAVLSLESTRHRVWTAKHNQRLSPKATRAAELASVTACCLRAFCLALCCLFLSLMMMK